jgi:hypothetical protein
MSLSAMRNNTALLVPTPFGLPSPFARRAGGGDPPPLPSPFDPDAAAYIAAVESADGDALEDGVKTAINDFVVGCKADSIWAAIKASCILAGARTLSGALVPLVGASPTNFNFVSADYNRKTGLVGNGTTKYLDSNRANNDDPQNSQHLAVWVTQQIRPRGRDSGYIGDTFNTIGCSNILRSVSVNASLFAQSRSDRASGLSSAYRALDPVPTGLQCVTRGVSTEFVTRQDATNVTTTLTSGPPTSGTITVFRVAAVYSPERMAFYSAGEDIQPSLLDARIAALLTALDGAIT